MAYIECAQIVLDYTLVAGSVPHLTAEGQMRKTRLNMEDLDVRSFEVIPNPSGRSGTVKGREAETILCESHYTYGPGSCYNTCTPSICDSFCSYWQTCGPTACAFSCPPECQ